MSDNIGGKIRRVRKNKGMTLNDLAMGSGLSVSYISNLERDLCSPTLDNLMRICKVLEVSLVRLLDSMSWNEGIVRAEDREVVLEKPGQAKYEAINFGLDRLNGLVVTLEPGYAYNDTWGHDYDEIGLVMEGSLTLRVADNERVLNPGDCVYIGAGDEHTISNRSDATCVSYWVRRGE